MNYILIIVAVIAMALCVHGQSDLQKMIDTEREFEAFAEKNGNKAAFIEYAASAGVLFTPDKVNAKAYWNGRGEWNGLLLWAPNFADISSNGIIGYTYGNWEFRPKGREADPSAFGQFITVWQRQPDGRYRYVADIGIDHDKPAAYSKEWVAASVKSSNLNQKNLSAADSATGFYAKLAAEGPAKAYKAYAGADITVFRQGRTPIKGLKAMSETLKSDQGKYALSKRGSFFGSADIAYNLNTYTKTVGSEVVEKGNTLQIWKLVNGKWRLVLDIFKPVP